MIIHSFVSLLLSPSELFLSSSVEYSRSSMILLFGWRFPAAHVCRHESLQFPVDYDRYISLLYGKYSLDDDFFNQEFFLGMRVELVCHGKEYEVCRRNAVECSRNSYGHRGSQAFRVADAFKNLYYAKKRCQESENR